MAGVQEPPLPVTLRPAFVPVLFRMMPFEGFVLLPVTEILWNVSPLVPIVVLLTLSAVPVVVVSVFTTDVALPHGFLSQILTVPAEVAGAVACDVNAALAPVVRFIPPEKLYVAVDVTLVSIKIPEPVLVSAPVKVTVPLVLLATLIRRAVVLVIVPA